MRTNATPAFLHSAFAMSWMDLQKRKLLHAWRLFFLNSDIITNRFANGFFKTLALTMLCQPHQAVQVGDVKSTTLSHRPDAIWSRMNCVKESRATSFVKSKAQLMTDPLIGSGCA